MKRFLGTCLLITCSLASTGQLQALESERIALVTDRALYVAGESLWLSGVYMPEDNNATGDVIIYVELITPGGEQILGMKFKSDQGKFEGGMKIPKEIKSGIYYVRAYTRNTRNSLYEDFAYQCVKIVNPFKKEFHSPDQSVVRSGDTLLISDHEQGHGFIIETLKDTFRTRQMIHVDLIQAEPARDSLVMQTVTVVPAGSYHYKTTEAPEAPEAGTNHPAFQLERNGVIISGRFSGNLDQTTTVNITMFGEKINYFYPVQPDSTGRFQFAFPEIYGKRDLFISSSPGNDSSTLLINNDYYSDPVSLPSPKFILSDIERTTVLNMAVNLQVRAHYPLGDHSEDFLRSGISDKDTIPFYGKPDRTFYIADYIELPSLSDYFVELPTSLKINRSKKTSKITVTSDDPGLQLFSPLLMVDYIPVNSPDVILDIVPQRVLRFDVIRSTYNRGETIYGGIVNVISKKNDFAGIRLPDNGLFLNYQFLSKSSDFEALKTPLRDHYPDTRNTLYWDSDFDAKELNSFNFYSSDNEGDYCIQVTGITTDGNLVSSSKTIHIKN